MNNKTYIGDGVYLEVHSPFEIILTTENGISIQNTIHLELEMLERIVQLARRKLEILSPAGDEK